MFKPAQGVVTGACFTCFTGLRRLCKCLWQLSAACEKVVTSTCFTCFTSVYKLSQVDLSTCVSLRKLTQVLTQAGSCWDRSGSCWDKWGHVGTGQSHVCVWQLFGPFLIVILIMSGSCCRPFLPCSLLWFGVWQLFALFLIVILIMSQHDFDLDLSTCVSLRKLTQA